MCSEQCVVFYYNVLGSRTVGKNDEGSESNCLLWNPDSATYYFCEGKSINLFKPASSVKWGHYSPYILDRGLKEVIHIMEKLP